MARGSQADIVRNGWELLGTGDFDGLADCYAEDMVFVLPGQDDVLKGRAAFRSALDDIGQVLPPGFDIKGISYCSGDDEVVNIVHFTADKLPAGSQCAVLFRFGANDKIVEERWFIDTEQWKAAF